MSCRESLHSYTCSLEKLRPSDVIDNGVGVAELDTHLEGAAAALQSSHEGGGEGRGSSQSAVVPDICRVSIVRQSELYEPAPSLTGSANPILDGAQLG
jgi:hypothetical protein